MTPKVSRNVRDRWDESLRPAACAASVSVAPVRASSTARLANAEVHRFHHRKGGAAGDVNFGLFTTLWDHLVGTFHYQSGTAPARSEDVGIQGADDYPNDYLAQLVQPFREWLVYPARRST